MKLDRGKLLQVRISPLDDNLYLTILLLLFSIEGNAFVPVPT